MALMAFESNAEPGYYNLTIYSHPATIELEVRANPFPASGFSFVKTDQKIRKKYVEKVAQVF